ncbi:helix-turn-helix domain-containing protein [Limnoglobus roseus]|uniref:XRE family transcriptional regulator n=1 Tax=Limnoglobus roseus TaxID=2598579 RepID=A0A5C1AMC3_9BACT|nr:helix-turn-helix domain-containing protein [Limnoglobus roseus]QEL19277.1 hypothetical protein PX52LOC_06340 [Limnoglobus roseus]
MTRAELETIVMSWGGVDNFAKVMHVTPRTVYYWLAGTRRITPMAETLIRMLSPTNNS